MKVIDNYLQERAKLNRILQNQNIDTTDIINNGKSAINEIRSYLKNNNIEYELIINYGMEIGKSKKFKKLLRNNPQQTINKLFNDLFKEQLIFINSNSSIITASYILLIHGTSLGICKQFKIDAESSYFITASSLVSQSKNISQLCNNQFTKFISWIMELRKAFEGYNIKQTNQILISYIFTTSNLPFYKKFFKRGVGKISSYIFGISGILFVGSAGIHFLWYLDNYWKNTADLQEKFNSFGDVLFNSEDVVDITKILSQWPESYFSFVSNIASKIKETIEDHFSEEEIEPENPVEKTVGTMDKITNNIGDALTFWN